MTIAFLRKPMQTFNRATSSFNAKKREVDAAWGGPPMAQRTPTLPALVLQPVEAYAPGSASSLSAATPLR